MPIERIIEYTSLDKLYLDPENPRLGREHTGKDVKQPRVLELMNDWALEELAVSFLESGFWPQEALIVIEEELYGKKRLVVIEGNRRLAALKLLNAAYEGVGKSPKWKEIADSKSPPKNLFSEIPFIKVGSRQEVEAFIGFRHVTGIKEWRPAEKAEYIAHLIEDRKMSYEHVTGKIGSRVAVVRQNYISYRLLLQMEDEEGISTENVEEKFSVLYLSLRTAGVQKYLDINIKGSPSQVLRPVPKSKLKALANFALWLFGNDDKRPIVRESRQVDSFGKILESKKAVEYLERSDSPSFETAHRMAGGDEPELVRLIDKAADNIEASLSRAHLYEDSKKLQEAIFRLGLDTGQILKLFPTIRDRVREKVD
jgi:hypothetical protein